MTAPTVSTASPTTWTYHGFPRGGCERGRRWGQRYGGGCTTASLCVEEMRQPSARPSYTLEAAEGCGTVDNGICFIGKGGRRPHSRRGITINVVQTAEAMPRRQIGAPLRRRIELDHRGRSKRSCGTTAQHPPRRIRGAYFGHVCVSTDWPVTMRRATGPGCRRSGPTQTDVK